MRTDTSTMGTRRRRYGRRLALLGLAGLVALPLGTVTGLTRAAAAPGVHKVKTRANPAASPITGAMSNHGGPVQNKPVVYVDFWGWSSDPNGEQGYLLHFLQGAGGAPWLATVGQYGAGNPTAMYGGSWSDTVNAVPQSPSDAAIQQEAEVASVYFGAGNSVNAQIIVATPSGHSTPGFGTSFCAYHGSLSTGVTYTNLPYMTDAGTSCGQNALNAGGTLDGVSIVEGHELAETITDPHLDAWYDGTGNEIGDKCAWYNLTNVTLPTGTFAVQPLWSNEANGCAASSAGYQAAFQSIAPLLSTYSSTAGAATSTSAMAPGTSPSIAPQPNGGYVMAYQGANGDLWTTGPSGTADSNIAMLSGTSPSVAELSGGGYEVAFQASSTDLWTVGTAGTTNWQTGMASGTSPSIAGLAGGGFEVAFQANTTALWTVGNAGNTNWNLGMASGTSPSIAGLAGGGFQVAFQANTTALWTVGNAGNTNWNLGMATSTSPSIAALPGGGFEVAFQANTNHLWLLFNATQGYDTGQTMSASASPGLAVS